MDNYKFYINDNNFIELLKKYTLIDHDFINIFFKKFKIGHELDFHIKDEDVAKYLDVKLNTIRRRLNNTFTKSKNFFENVDYIKIKNGNTSASITYMINYQCFERLAMSSDTQKSESVRMYFVKLREFLTENQRLIYQSMTNYEELNKYIGYETIYFFAVDERKTDIFKIGRTKNIIQRLKNYNIGRIKEIDLKYLALVKNSILIESCMKLKLKKNQVIKNKEIYQIEPTKLKKIINECYCKYVSKNKNDNLYEELSNLLGLYSYCKDKINIKPFIIIDK
jgi:phage anti-repressor protein